MRDSQFRCLAFGRPDEQHDSERNSGHAGLQSHTQVPGQNHWSDSVMHLTAVAGTFRSCFSILSFITACSLRAIKGVMEAMYEIHTCGRRPPQISSVVSSSQHRLLSLQGYLWREASIIGIEFEFEFPFEKALPAPVTSNPTTKHTDNLLYVPATSVQA